MVTSHPLVDPDNEDHKDKDKGQCRADNCEKPFEPSEENKFMFCWNCNKATCMDCRNKQLRVRICWECAVLSQPKFVKSLKDTRVHRAFQTIDKLGFELMEEPKTAENKWTCFSSIVQEIPELKDKFPKEMQRCPCHLKHSLTKFWINDLEMVPKFRIRNSNLNMCLICLLRWQKLMESPEYDDFSGKFDMFVQRIMNKKLPMSKFLKEAWDKYEPAVHFNQEQKSL